MTGNLILSRIAELRSRVHPEEPLVRNMHWLWLHPDRLPHFVTDSPTAQRTLELLGPLDWSALPERNLVRNWGQTTVPYTAFAAAYLIKLNEGLRSMGDLRQYLVEHPAIFWLCGFPLASPSSQSKAVQSQDVDASLPTQRHLTRMLRNMPNEFLQCLLAQSVKLILKQLSARHLDVGDCVVVDTKHIIAWVKENNLKTYVEDRYDKTKQPHGDPDCRLGCKRRHNQKTGAERVPDLPATPAKESVPAAGLAFGEYYWGYGSGIVIVTVPDCGEFVLAEMTQPFDQPDVSYFFPLMTQVEQRLGRKPRCGALDAAFDAWYIYAYFHRPDDPGAFAAVPFSEKGGYKAGERLFSPDGLPLCAAGLPMPLHFTFTDRTTTLVEHERGKYVCPLLFPSPTGQPCPIQHKSFAKKGCTAQMPTSIGARLRYSLDRTSQTYKDIYHQRSAIERINSQAVALGIERPHIRNGAAISNLNTLIYILVNLRLLHRLLHPKAPSN